MPCPYRRLDAARAAREIRELCDANRVYRGAGHTCPRTRSSGRGTRAGPGQGAAEIALLRLVAQAGQPGAQALRAEQVQEGPDVRRAAHRDDEDAFAAQSLPRRAASDSSAAWSL